MHIADYLVLGLLIACMLEAAAVVLSRSENRGGGKRRGGICWPKFWPKLTGKCSNCLAFDKQ